MIAEEISTDVTIQPVSYATILDDPRAADLLRAYAEECVVSEAQPQRAIYAAMEQGGALQCFAAYFGPSFLIGFVSVLRSIVPHDGLSVATTESLFVDPAYRHTSAFEDLFSAAERYVTNSGSDVFSCGARIGSALDKVLSRRSGFTATHTQHTKWLNDRKERRRV